MTSYSCSTATMGLSRTVSEINGDFSRKPQIFPTHVYFAPPLKVSPWNLVSMLAVKKIRIMGLPDWERSLTISSTVWIQSTNVTDRQTDRQTDTGRQQIPRLRIASRGKITSILHLAENRLTAGNDDFRILNWLLLGEREIVRQQTRRSISSFSLRARARFASSSLAVNLVWSSSNCGSIWLYYTPQRHRSFAGKGKGDVDLYK